MKTIFSKIFVFFAVLASAWPANALTLRIQSPKPTSVSIELPTPAANSNVGVISVEGFKMLGVPFEGSPAGITAIDGLGSDLQVINENRMKAWGWCFSIDGQLIEKMPDQVPWPQEAKILRWFYAYALYDSGQWTGYCIEDK